jgi:hypothetical protein
VNRSFSPDRIVAVEIVPVAVTTDLDGWARGPYRDDPGWPDRDDWQLISDLRNDFTEPFASVVSDPQGRRHRLVEDAEEPDILSADLLLLDEEPSAVALLAVHFALHAQREIEIRMARRNYTERLPMIVRRLGLDCSTAEPLAELLCVPKPTLVPEPQVRPSEFTGYYWHLRMWALANPGWARDPSGIDKRAFVSYTPWTNVPEHDVLVGARTTVAVGDDNFALEALQRSVLLDVLLYAGAQKAILFALERDAARLADPRREPALAVEISRRARRYRALHHSEQTGDDALDRIVRRYRALNELDRLENKLPQFEQLGDVAVSGASTVLKGLAAVVGFGVAVAGLVRLAGTGTDIQLAALVVALLISAATLLLTPFGAVLRKELRRTVSGQLIRHLRSRALARFRARRPSH